LKKKKIVLKILVKII